jgi:hypothetical protein
MSRDKNKAVQRAADSMTARQFKLCPCGRETDADCEWMVDPAAAWAKLARLKERMPNWPHPGEGQSFADALELLQHKEQAWKCLAYVPPTGGYTGWGKLLAERPDFRSDFFTTEDVLWAVPDKICVGVTNGSAPPTEVLRKKGRGRPPIWRSTDGSTEDGRILVELVEAGLKAMGLRRERPMVDQVITAIRKGAPAHYGTWSHDTLRKAYYVARDRVSGKSGK